MFQQGVEMAGEGGRKGGKEKRQAVLFVEFFWLQIPRVGPVSVLLSWHYTHTQNLKFPL